MLIAFDETTSIVPELIRVGVAPTDVPTYFVDGNLANYQEDPDDPEKKFLPPGSLTGVKGTLPGAEATGDFQDRLLGINPTLTDFSYSAESYDATVVSALAAIAAGSDAGCGRRDGDHQRHPGRHQVHHLRGVRCPAG